jgi:D-alanyl-lipoteichoic acid acyltransferase DltB (MBOAT superfamily)
MLFNSYEFVFAFLPVTVVVFFALGAASRTWALRWIIVASLFFYAWWRPVNLLIVTPSILVNFVLARALRRFQERRGVADAVLWTGIAFNVAFLGYFKYANFAASVVNDVFGTQFVLAQIVLPLGISFITFQKIAFLIDVHAERIQAFRFQDYCLFVLFFPQLIAGPIVHYRELMPQLERARCVFDGENVSIGLTLFVVGLCKKVFLADSVAPLVNAVYEQAASGGPVAFLPAWLGAVGFTLQIYFDFSGYSEMALGIARFFGIRLPLNFNSPLRASSIIDFWLRWHVTLTRFLTAYIYNPLALALTRRRVARGAQPIGAPAATVGSFVELIMFPTLLTMLVSGIWHGAGYLFILWGFLHGLYLSVNHAWRLTIARTWKNKKAYARVMSPIGFLITFGCVVISMVVFRSSTLPTVIEIWKGMLGLSGFTFHNGIADVERMGIWVMVLAVIAFLGPNTLELLSKYDPALGWIGRHASDATTPGRPVWRPSLAWAVAIAFVSSIGILYLGGQTEFLYWQF